MRRLALVSLIACLLLAGVAALAYGVLFTTQGISWLMRLVGAAASVSISAEALEGTAAGGFSVRNMAVRWKDGSATTTFLAVRMEPLRLLSGSISLAEVKLGRLVIDDQVPAKKPVDLTLPRVTGALARLRGRVTTLTAEELSYTMGRGPPLIFRSIRAGADWDHAVLTVSNLSLDTPVATVEGRGAVSLLHPALQLDLTARLGELFLGCDQVSVNAMLRPARHPEHVAGAISVSATKGSVEGFYGKADLAVESHALTLRNMVLSQEKRKGTLNGHGRIAFTVSEPIITADLTLKDVHLFREGAYPGVVSGNVSVGGSPKAYEGTFRIGAAGAAWQSGRLGGRFNGDIDGVTITIANGSALNGRVDGEVKLSWAQGAVIRGGLWARALDPALLHKDLRGTLNAFAEAELRWGPEGALLGKASLRLRESVLQEKRLSGELQALFLPKGLRIDNALLKGKGFLLSAKGTLDERMEFEADVSDINGLFSSLQGRAGGRGWVRLRKGRWAGAIRLEGRSMNLGALRCSRINLGAAVDEEGAGTVQLKGAALGGQIGVVPFDRIGVDLGGAVKGHQATIEYQAKQGSGSMRLNGSFADGSWVGSVDAMTVDVPRGRPLRLASRSGLTLSQGRFALSSFVLTNEGGERIEAAADISPGSKAGFANLRWKALDLGRVNPFLRGRRVDGDTSGSVGVRLLGGSRMDLDTSVHAKGSHASNGQRLEVKGISLEGSWNDRGLRCFLEANGADGAVFRGNISASELGRLAFPGEALVGASWERVDLALAKPWLPPELVVQGYLEGRFEGRLLRKGVFDARGGAKIAGGSLGWRDRDARVRAGIKTAILQMNWKDGSLKGDAAINLEEQGRMEASFALPIPARYPFAVNRDGTIEVSVAGSAKEMGLLPALLRGAVRGTKGSLKIDAGLRGTWTEPRLDGRLILADASAYVPLLGIRVEDVSAQVRLTDDRIEVTSFEGKSGPGHVRVAALFRTKDWRIANYEGTVKGERFQAIFLPEVQALVTPSLSFQGKGRDVSLNGEIVIPDADIRGRQGPDVVRASPDVVIVDKGKKDTDAHAGFPLSGKIHVLLGEKVAIRMEGLEGRLVGDGVLTLKDSKNVAVSGEVRIVEGVFGYYGQTLNIERGRIIFGGPPDNPSLDILALKKVKGFQSIEERVGEVRAGVAVTGTVKAPFYKLYSQPPMPDVDVLSYILLGRTTAKTQGKDSSDTVMGAAGALAYGSLKGKIAPDMSFIDSVDVQSGGKDVSRSLVTVGKYLNPRLYLGLGGSLFSNTYQIILRYSLTPNLDVETRSGTESGGSIYYKIDFD